MLKYYVLLFVVVGLALFYVFLEDPCHQQLRTDFSAMYPSYEILDSGAAEGSPETVRCHITYRKPDGDQVYQDTWLYQRTDTDWKFSRILETQEKEETP